MGAAQLGAQELQLEWHLLLHRDGMFNLGKHNLGMWQWQRSSFGKWHFGKHNLGISSLGMHHDFLWQQPLLQPW